MDIDDIIIIVKGYLSRLGGIMKTLTSASANKLIKSLEDQKNYLLSLEASSSVYILAEGEQAEPPHYDYSATSEEVNRINQQVRKLKHAINVFNTTTILEPLDITIDEALIKMAQLNHRKLQLDTMRKRLPKERQAVPFTRTNIIEYQYVNYDIGQVATDYNRLCEEIMEIQLALDTCNQTKTFDVDL